MADILGTAAVSIGIERVKFGLSVESVVIHCAAAEEDDLQP